MKHWMIRCSLAVLFLLSLSACAPAAVELPQHYDGKVSGISVGLDFPADWSVLEMGGNVIAVTRDDHTGITIASGLPFEPTVENMDVMLYSIFNRYATFMSDMRVMEDPVDVIVGGIPARALLFEGVENRSGLSTPIRFYLIAGGSEGVDFSIEARALTTDWPEVESQVLAVIDTIYFD